MNARQFLIDTSEKISIAVDNGMDIRMEESEWLQKMEEYADAKVRKLNLSGIGSKRPYYQLCPKCAGEGQIDNIGNSTSTSRVCPVCNGSRTLYHSGDQAACASGGEDTKPEGGYCECEFVMIMRDQKTQIAYCSQCEKEVNEQ